MIPPSPAISPEARKSIEQLLETVRLYGQALQALATDGATGTLDQNTKNIATGLQKFDAGVLNPLTGSDKPVLPATAVDGVVAGVRAVADFAIGRIIAKDVQQAARDRDGDLKAVVEALKQINTRYGDIADDEIARELRGANTSVLRSGKATMADFDSLTAQGRSMALATDPRKANAALDALVTSNNAIATAGPGGAWAEVQSFVQAATDAYNYYKSLPQ
jgi:ElaB/YqjD/DUF883 family membrane-anchored ribosome-binding protein